MPGFALVSVTTRNQDKFLALQEHRVHGEKEREKRKFQYLMNFQWRFLSSLWASGASEGISACAVTCRKMAVSEVGSSYTENSSTVILFSQLGLL